MAIIMPKQPIELKKRLEPPPTPAWARDEEKLLVSSPSAVRMALTGGIATGKSTAAELLSLFGASIIDFDLLARKTLEPESPGWEKTIKLFGPKIKNSDGSLNRALMGKKVFKDSRLRLELEAIIHPLTWRMMIGELKVLRENPFIVIDVPLLFEANLAQMFSPIVLCFASAITQLNRLTNRQPDLSRRAAKRIIASQTPMAEKVRRASYIINNDGSLSQIIRQIKKLWLDFTDQNPEINPYL